MSTREGGVLVIQKGMGDTMINLSDFWQYHAREETTLIVTEGGFANVLAVCSHAQLSCLGITAITLLLHFTPLSNLFGFAAMPAVLLAAMGGIFFLYIIAAEAVKKYFYSNRINGLSAIGRARGHQ